MINYLSGINILMVLLCLNAELRAATYRDFKTKTSGNWNATSTWQWYNGSSWADATWTPTSADENITIQAGHAVTITASVTVDQVDVKANLTLNAGVILTINNGSSTDFSISNSAYFYVYGTIINEGSFIKSSGVIHYYDNATYKHAQNSGTIEDAIWEANSTCEITGVTTTKPSNLDQSFGNFTWNCSLQTTIENFGNALSTVNGNFSLLSTGSGGIQISQSAVLTIKGDYYQSGGNFYLTIESSDNTIIVEGNFYLLAGNLSNPGGNGAHCGLIFTKSGTQTYVKTLPPTAQFYGEINIKVENGAILDMSDDIIDGSTGTFTLESGAGLKTMDPNGITSSGASGCIQVYGARSYAQGAFYTFYANGNQSTGNGFSTTLTGTLTVGSTSNATNLSITNGSVAVNNKLTLMSNSSANSSVSGTVSYGSGGTLEYIGGIGQTATSAEWPSSGGPPNVIINNSNGVSLPSGFGRTITGTLYLTSGAFSMGSNLLTLNNGAINKTSGSLTGGSTSSLTFSGAGSTSLPGVLNGLSKLTLNRSSSTITISGNTQVIDTLILTNGSFALSGGAISYGTNGTLKYNGSTTQTTANAEFPASGGPKNLFIKNTSGVILHAGRSLDGTLFLNSGAFSIGTANTLTLNKDISIVSGSLTGGSSSNITIGEYPSALTLPSIANGLNNLTVNRTSGVNLGASLTLGGTLSLTAGPLSIGSTTLTLNGLLIKSTGSLTGGLNSNIIAGGTGVVALDLPQVSLNNLTLNRSSGGIRQIGNITVNGTMTMTSGSLNNNGWTFQYGSGGTLKYNGTFSQTTTSNEFPVSSGPFNLYIDNAIAVGLHADRTVGGTLTLNTGQFSIGAHTLTLNGGITQNPDASLSGGGFSNIIFGENISGTNLPAVQLNDLTIHRSAGIGLSGNVTTEGNLSLESGSLAIGSTTLTVNGPISQSGGSLSGGSGSNIIFGGTGDAASLEAINLNTLTLNRASGLDLADSVTVYGQFILMNGQIRRHNYKLYGPSAMLRYNYFSTQSTSEEEFPDTGGPLSIMIEMVSNSDRMNLHGNKTVRGDLVLNRGIFSIGAHTLTLNGLIMPGLGSLAGGLTSNLVFDGSAGGTNLPGIKLNNLTINRATGIVMSGDVSVFGTLDLNSGTFSVNSYTLELNGGPISGTLSNLQTTMNSGLYFGGNATGISIPSVVLQLGKLKVANPNGVEMTTNLSVTISVIDSNYLICGDKSIIGPGMFMMASNSKLAVGHHLGVMGSISLGGPKMISPETDFEFNGTVDQHTNFLPTMTPWTIRNLIINNSNDAVVTLTENMTFTGDVEVMTQSNLKIDSSIQCEVQGDVVIHAD